MKCISNDQYFYYLHINTNKYQKFELNKSIVSIIILRKLNIGPNIIADFFLLIQYVQDEFFLTEVIESHLLKNDQDNKEGRSPNKDPKGDSKRTVNLDDQQAKYIESNSNKIMSNCDDMSQIVLLFLSKVSNYIFTGKIFNDRVNIVHLKTRSNDQYKKSNQSYTEK